MLAVPIATPQIWLFYAFGLVFAALVVRMLVRRTKEGAASLGVPLVAEAGTGHSWAEAH